MADFEWTFYNFDENWDEFYRVWQTDEVQHVLEKEMDFFCVTCPSFINVHSGLDDELKPPKIWKKRDPLWYLEDSDYHEDKIIRAVYKKLENENVYHNYIKTMKHIFPGKRMDSEEFSFALDDFFLKAFRKECSHQPHTIDSLALIGGRNFISSALYKCAKQLFPYCQIYYIENGSHDLVYLPDEKIIFDLISYYQVTRDYLEIDPQHLVNQAHTHNHGDHTIVFSDEDDDVFYEEPSDSSSC